MRAFRYFTVKLGVQLGVILLLANGVFNFYDNLLQLPDVLFGGALRSQTGDGRFQMIKTSNKSSVSCWRLLTMANPSGSSERPWRSETKLPAPWRIVMIFFEARIFRASRMVFRPAPSCSHSSLSVGNLSPGT